MADKTSKPWMVAGETDDPNAEIETFEADSAIAKGHAVYLSDDGKVTGASSAQNCIGIAVKSVADGDPCPVLTRGRVKVIAGEAIPRGSGVYGADADGKILRLYDQTVNEGGSAEYTILYSRKLGKALQTADAEDDLIFIKVGA